tara:strand:+ start:950 stop:1225 length:276 start_codon:yes stop_codon:yes gene_type:complete
VVDLELLEVVVEVVPEVIEHQLMVHHPYKDQHYKYLEETTLSQLEVVVLQPLHLQHHAQLEQMEVILYLDVLHLQEVVLVVVIPHLILLQE